MDTVAVDDKRRISNAEFIKENCGTNRFPATTSGSANVYWQLILLVPDSIKAQPFFAERGVDIATSSLELVSAMTEYPNQARLPAAEKIYRNGIFIPCFPNLCKSDMVRTAAATKEFFQEYSNSEQQ
jgi:dTDP-4-amino-4,6-dideoxygalactose transaminase